MSGDTSTKAIILQRSSEDREMRVPESWSGGSDYSEIGISGPEANIEIGGTLTIDPASNLDVLQVNQTTEQATSEDEGRIIEEPPAVEDDAGINATPPNFNQIEHAHQPLRAMGGLSGERFSVEIEDQGNEPWDGSHKHLRNLSPFTIQLLPPEEFVKTESSGNSDPYSWDRLSNLVGKKVKLKSSDSIQERVTSIDQAISSLQMYVHNGEITPQMRETLKGTIDTYASPFFSLANVADVYIQLLEMFKTPPLILLVNPSSMSVNYNKIQNFSERTRYGYIYQAWGEELPTLNFSGRIGAYIGGESAQEKRGSYSDKIIKNQETTHVSGVQEVSRRVSPAYQNLMQLLLLYKNNAYIRDNVGKSQANHMVGTVEISYDGVRYNGHFDKLEWTFEETNNLGGVNFSFDFTATRIVHTDERNSIPMKQRNPNEGSRFGDERSDRSRAGAMKAYEARLERSNGGIFLGGVVGIEQNLASVDEDGNIVAGDSVRSWRNQAAETVVGQSIAVAQDDYEEGEYDTQDSSGIIRRTRDYTPEDM